ncbi:unnamed protein product, partial [Lymnaea stagnalis]
PINLSNTSTPDLTELINLVKPSESNNRAHVSSDNNSHYSTAEQSQYHSSLGTHLPVSLNSSDLMTTSDSLTKPSVIQLHSGSAQISSISQPYNTANVVSADLDALNVS